MDALLGGACQAVAQSPKPGKGNLAPGYDLEQAEGLVQRGLDDLALLALP